MTEEKYIDPTTKAEAKQDIHFEEVRETTSQSAEINELVGALAKAQSQFKPIVKDTQNPFFKSKYADLATIIAATQTALSTNGLVVMQQPQVQAHSAGVKTVLAHSSGQWIWSELMLPAAQGSKFDAQTVGSALTYARRYALQAILGVAADVDDDGNAAAGNSGSKADAQNVAKAKLEESAKSSDPKTAAIAKEGLAKINAVDTAKNLEGQLQRSLEAQKDDGLFDEVKGVIQGVRNMSTSATKGSKPYRRVAMACFDANNEPYDLEMSLFEDFPLGNSTAFMVLDGAMSGDAGAFTVERKGKYVNIKDIKQIAGMHWSPSVGR